MTGPFCFPKAFRLRARTEYLRLSITTKKAHSAHYLVIWGPSMGQSPVRVGITASRKVGGAVQRNRIKRVLREYVRIHLNLFPPSDYNIIAKRGADRLGYSEACRELDDLLKNISSRLC